MSFEEWQQCAYPAMMLRYLRGSVPESERTGGCISPGWSGGPIYPGPSPYATREQCMELGRRMSLLWSAMVNQPGDELEDMWGGKAADLNDLYGTACFLSHAATIGYAHSKAFARAGLPEEDYAWGWSGGPDDPEASGALRVLHACLIRQVFRWPGIPMPDA